MKRARKVSNVRGEVHSKQKQRLTIVFIGNTMPSTCNCTKNELPHCAPK